MPAPLHHRLHPTTTDPPNPATVTASPPPVYAHRTTICAYKMSSSQFNAGQARGETQEKTEQWMESAKNTANKAHDKAFDAAGKTQEEAHRSKEETTGFLQQTGEQVAHMAQGAIDGVKNTLGMGDKK
ncbi:hypothetical protein BUALT_Bualt14G0046100 [Buddleja alternifolia]|uniref:Late embryogenesis abundant protein 1-like n=1 Tax=Buddleja alternifolia TaxID=168488 RepID=A0AAV6WG84_9LAMI|nr:hypothetical protein BUALT_Bualt14G0046100 [Buddleja alternifolia]